METVNIPPTVNVLGPVFSEEYARSIVLLVREREKKERKRNTVNKKEKRNTADGWIPRFMSRDTYSTVFDDFPPSSGTILTTRTNKRRAFILFFGSSFRVS